MMMASGGGGGPGWWTGGEKEGGRKKSNKATEKTTTYFATYDFLSCRVVQLWRAYGFVLLNEDDRGAALAPPADDPCTARTQRASQASKTIELGPSIVAVCEARPSWDVGGSLAGRAPRLCHLFVPRNSNFRTIPNRTPPSTPPSLSQALVRDQAVIQENLRVGVRDIGGSLD